MTRASLLFRLSRYTEARDVLMPVVEREPNRPLVATAPATSLVQSSESIYAYERDDERTESTTKVLDSKLRKMIDLGEARFEVPVDAANIFNSQPALSLIADFGSRYLQPSPRLIPRIVRFTAKLLF